MTKMPHLQELKYDYANQLHDITLDASGNKAYYVYDASGNRVRKVVEKGNITEERFYVGNYEYFTKTNNGTIEEERETVKVSDDKQVIALIDNDIQSSLFTIRYQLTNHLDSASLELDELGHIISYEEYHPFGTTSYRSGNSPDNVSLKRYKYVFKELDNETGLYYYGMRYYAPWVARFVSVDPLQFKYQYYTPFQYAGNKPISYIDLDGAEENPASKLYFQARNNIIATSNGPTVAAAKELDALDASYSIYSVRQNHAAAYKQFDKHVENQKKNPNLLVKSQLTPMQQDMRAGRPLDQLQVSVETDVFLRGTSAGAMAYTSLVSSGGLAMVSNFGTNATISMAQNGDLSGVDWADIPLSAIPNFWVSSLSSATIDITESEGINLMAGNQFNVSCIKNKELKYVAIDMATDAVFYKISKNIQVYRSNELRNDYDRLQSAKKYYQTVSSMKHYHDPGGYYLNQASRGLSSASLHYQASKNNYLLMNNVFQSLGVVMPETVKGLIKQNVNTN